MCHKVNVVIQIIKITCTEVQKRVEMTQWKFFSTDKTYKIEKAKNGEAVRKLGD